MFFYLKLKFLSYVFSSGMDPVKGLDDYITSKGYSTEDTEAFSQAKRDFSRRPRSIAGLQSDPV